MKWKFVSQSWLFAFLLSSCTTTFYQPDHSYYVLPKKIGLNPQENVFKSNDGTRLLGWFFLPKETPVKGIVIQFHGNAENMSSHYLNLVWLLSHQYALFTFDYRGYGGSLGDPTPRGVYEDSLAALDEAMRLRQVNGLQNTPVIVVGQSLGGAIAMRALEDFRKRDVIQLLVVDSTFLSYKKMGAATLRSHWFTWLFSPLGSLLVSDEFEATRSIQNYPGRVLVIHDRRDPVVPFEFGERIYELAPGKKDFWILDQGRHIGAFTEDNLEWRTKFVDLLNSLH